MTKNQRNYTEEFRREAVRLMETSGKLVAQIARDLGVNDNVLYRWRRLWQAIRVGTAGAGKQRGRGDA